MVWIFCPVDDKRVIRDNFDCGVTELNEYLLQYAKQNHNKGIAKTWVAISEQKNGEVAGYYSISMASLQRESLPSNYRQGLPRYPLPVIRLGKLAVTRSRQNQGLGEMLLIDAFNRGVKLSQDIGMLGVIVDALNAQAKRFYLKYGFIELEDNTLSLFIPLKKILEALS